MPRTYEGRHLMPGTALDDRIAAEIMGWKKRKRGGTGKYSVEDVYETEDGSLVICSHFRPSTADEDALKVIRELAKHRVEVSLGIRPTKHWPQEEEPCDPDELWTCGMGISGTDMCWTVAAGAEMPIAVCRAALGDREPKTDTSNQ